MTPAGRPREFDLDVALDAAMRTFWLHGFDGTSMSQIVEATGVQKGSLYKAFGDKHALFLQALKRYLETMMAEITPKVFAATTAEEGVRIFFEHGRDRCVDEGGALRGCMVMNTLMENPESDPLTMGIIRDHMTEALEALTMLVRNGQEAGEFRTDVDAAQVADYLLTLGSGMITKMQGGLTPFGELSAADLALQMLKTT